MARIRRGLAQSSPMDLRLKDRPPDFTVHIEREYFPDLSTSIRQSLGPTASKAELNYYALEQSLPDGFTVPATIDLLMLWQRGAGALAKWRRANATEAARKEVRAAMVMFCAMQPDPDTVDGCNLFTESPSRE